MTIISQDIQNPTKGVIVFGPKKDIFQGLLPYIPKSRADDLVYFNPMDAKPPIIGFNPFAFDDEFNSLKSATKPYSTRVASWQPYWSVLWAILATP